MLAPKGIQFYDLLSMGTNILLAAEVSTLASSVDPDEQDLRATHGKLPKVGPPPSWQIDPRGLSNGPSILTAFRKAGMSITVRGMGRAEYREQDTTVLSR